MGDMEFLDPPDEHAFLVELIKETEQKIRQCFGLPKKLLGRVRPTIFEE